MSQIFDYGSTDIEKRAIFYKRLIPLLEFGREREGIDLSKVVLTHHIMRKLAKPNLSLHEGESPLLQPPTDVGSAPANRRAQDKERAPVAEIIEKVNNLFVGELTDQDNPFYIIESLDAHTLMSTQALNSPQVQSGLKDILLNYAGLWENLRGQGGAVSPS